MMPKSRFLRFVPITLLVLCLLLVWSIHLSPSLGGVNSKSSSNIRHNLAEQAERQKRKDHQRYIQDRLSVREPAMDDDEGMRHLSFTHDIAVTIPIKPWTVSDTQSLQSSLVGQSLLSALLTSPEHNPDFKTLAFQQRTFKALFQYFDPILAEGEIDVSTDPLYRDAWMLYRRLENTLYPWIQPYYDNAFQLANMTDGRGIVMCLHHNRFQSALTNLRVIREVLESDLPVEIFYLRDGDLSSAEIAYLETEFDKVNVVQVTTRINNWYTKLGDWALRPYAILTSSFAEVIMIDPDAYFFKKPEVLFDDAGYRKTGTLFFYDRTLFGGWEAGRFWLESFLTTWSSFVPRSRWWNLQSAHEQEASVVAIDKKRALLGLLSTCKMNDQRERDHATYRHSHGDKESYWIGFEMVQTPYAFIKSYAGVIGGLGDGAEPQHVCGNQLHLNVDRTPLWWSGGLTYKQKYLKITHFAEGQDWDFERSCIKDTNHVREITPLIQNQTQQYISLDTQQQVISRSIAEGLWKPKKENGPIVSEEIGSP
ncbi:mannosyltransferase putative-domain-containing protein [Dichotomocladium elegans]|nr:mannosyltransferase putative-domain-containing protein [Dichotomocladium elegans]